MSADTRPSIDHIHFADIYVSWSSPHYGFGQLSVDLDRETGAININNECMPAERVRAILHSFVDKLVDEGQLEC